MDELCSLLVALQTFRAIDEEPFRKISSAVRAAVPHLHPFPQAGPVKLVPAVSYQGGLLAQTDAAEMRIVPLLKGLLTNDYFLSYHP